MTEKNQKFTKDSKCEQLIKTQNLNIDFMKLGYNCVSLNSFFPRIYQFGQMPCPLYP